MGNSDNKTNESTALKKVSAALFELRDALMGLSIALKDWQFETDAVQREKSATLVQELLQKLNARR